MSLVQHDTDLWSSEHEFGWQAGLVRLPVRMTVLRLNDSQLVLHSPVPISPQLQAELESLGPVGFIIVPRAHGRFAAQALRLFPTAEVLGALADHPPAAWAGQLEILLVRGFRLEEVVLFHPPSRTLVLTDLCFNIRRSRFGPSHLIRRLTVSDRAALRQSLETVLGWNFERIVPGHGDVIEQGGPAALRAAWLSS